MNREGTARESRYTSKTLLTKVLNFDETGSKASCYDERFFFFNTILGGR